MYSTQSERKEMKISEIDGCFIHFVIKEAPQNCENVCRKYNVSNIMYLPGKSCVRAAFILEVPVLKQLIAWNISSLDFVKFAWIKK